MFPKYLGFYFPMPSRFDAIKKATETNCLHVTSVHNPKVYEVLCTQLSLSVATLQQSYRYVTQELIKILPDLLGSQPISVSPFPQLTLPLVGTLVQPSPVSGYKKLVQIKKDLPTLGALSDSLLDDLLTGNDEELFKKIQRLQHANHSLFCDFFHVLNFNWDIIDYGYLDKYQTTLPALHTFRDEYGYFDCASFSTYLKDEDFLTDCVVKIIRGTKVQQFYALYGFGLRLILDGRMDVLAFILNDKLHPFDACFLKLILPSMIKVAFDGLENTNQLLYFKPVVSLLSDLNDRNFKNQDFTLLSALYEKVRESYNFSIVVSDPTKPPKTGERCIVHVLAKECPTDKPTKKLVFTNQRSFSTYSPYVIYHVNTFDYSAAAFTIEDNDVPDGVFDRNVLDPLLSYILQLVMQAPPGKFFKHQGRLGPLLRAIFPGFRMDLLTLPLSENELVVATHLLSTPSQVALNLVLQGYHLAQLLDTPSIPVAGLHLYIEGFIDLNQKLQTKGHSICQGSHDVYAIRPLHLTIEPGTAAQYKEIKAVYALWKSVFGFVSEPHPMYQVMENAPYCHARANNREYAFHLTPNTPAVKHTKTGMRFYPIAFADKGLYCHLSQGTRLQQTVKQSTQYIASGCCLLGNDLFATVETSDGRLSYHPLDAHSKAPHGTISDIRAPHEEHPEETMYLAIQKTLAPFYKAMYPGQEVIFYYHDLRIDYLMYLLPHYIRGTLSRDLLLKGIAIINSRHELMVSKLTAILSGHQIECRSYSALNALDTETLLHQVDQMKERYVANIECALSTFILDFLAMNETVPEQVRKVYRFVQSQKSYYDELLAQQGLHCIAIINYKAQFALINQMAKAPLLVALASIEYKLLKNYELLFAIEFGSLIHFLWMNPVNLRDDQKHNRLFFIDQDIPEYCRLIETTAESLQRIIKHQALDKPREVIAEVDALKVRLSTLPHFLAKPRPGSSSTSNPGQLITTTVQNTVSGFVI